jgi:hypothetical protein
MPHRPPKASFPGVRQIALWHAVPLWKILGKTDKTASAAFNESLETMSISQALPA